ncbi:MgtC/SapB family protein [Herbaspirillum sp. LeCh32-8]|uniref:MgtC/SapB family protein n=1 Tax=Herbaspirillum sp. LeCh32-8 TaxID=2821356 RepID=UPI001AE6F8B3|nr:MgtC/SapB family protein [Herbaspirillum sp. LeCh32-8]MBP0598154.1 MgtC/SapB family protein [Herbaspirillum sp. LeCh32-8]
MISTTDLILRLAVAAMLGGVIGIERQRLSRSAGLRTHMLVSLGASLFMLVSSYGFFSVLTADKVVLDPSRMAAQVVSGIGFLGAGSILLRGDIIRGLTTAASLWTAAAIGLATGAGMYEAGIAGTVLVLLILAGIRQLERRYFADKENRQLQLLVRSGMFDADLLRDTLGDGARQVDGFSVRKAVQEDCDEVTLTFTHLRPADLQQIMRTLLAHEAIRSINYAAH